MHDDLYAANVHAFFSRNPILQLETDFKGSSEQGGRGGDNLKDEFQIGLKHLDEMRKNNAGDPDFLHRTMTVKMIDQSLQNYLKDAVRTFDLKVFKAEIHLLNGQPQTFYFVNRLELCYTNCKGN